MEDYTDEASVRRLVTNKVVGNYRRYFEFKSSRALNNISFNEYDESLLEKVAKNYIEDSLKNGHADLERFSRDLDNNEFYALAHYFFNRGFIPCENSCFGGILFLKTPEEIKRKKRLLEP